MENITKRQSNFELLRIICMLMIIGHHIAVHGNYPQPESLGLNDYLIRFFTVGGKLGVNIFVLISGYFMINSTFRIQKLVRLIAQLLFYSIVISLILLISGKVEYSNRFLLNTLFPVSSNKWWFASAYVIVYCLSPYINVMIKNCSERKFIILIFLLIFIQCFVPFIFKATLLSNVAWFITLYLIAAYIRLYPLKIFNSNKILIPISLVSFILISLIKVFLNKDLWEMTNLICLICSVSIFCSFKNFNIPNSVIINSIARTTFGIYLMHDYVLMRSVIWNDLLNCQFHYQLNTFGCFVIVAIIVVFVACMIIDFVRELLFIATYKIIKLIKKKIKVDKEFSMCLEKIIIRPYNQADWEAIECIHDSARKIELNLANLSEAFLPLVIAAKRENLMNYKGLFVAEINNKVVGFTACTDEELAWLYVAPEYMRKGIGRKLALYAISVFPTIKYVEVLKGNEPAKRLYESIGFYIVSTERGKMPGNEDFLVEVYTMERK